LSLTEEPGIIIRVVITTGGGNFFHAETAFER
jgi:hypothetical protein